MGTLGVKDPPCHRYTQDIKHARASYHLCYGDDIFIVM